MTDLTFSPDQGCPSGLEPASDAPAGDMTAFVRRKNGLDTLTLSVRGAKCGGCLSKIEGAVTDIPGVQQARMNLSNGKLLVSWSDGDLANRIAERVAGLGYGVSAFSEDASAQSAKSEERRLLISMGVAAFALANIMLLSVSVWGGHGEMGETTRTALHAISGLIAFPVLLFSGRHFFQSAWSVLKHGRANMDVPISLALTLAFGVSVWETAIGGAHAYFDACVMLLFFLLIGRFLDARLRRQAHAAAHDLAALQNRSVNRVSASGQMESVRAEDVTKGDLIFLAAGERAVIDLKITSGTSSVDESLVTGESLPRAIQSGETLYAGTVNLDRPIEGEALGDASDSLLSDIAGMLEAGEQKRARYRKIADKAVSLYVPFVHTTAALTLVAWLMLGASPREAIMVAVATLIITCPCALALAAPVAQVVASGRLFRKGTYLRSGDALERFAEIDHIVLDKTGTLTLGTPALVSEHRDELRLAAQLARASRHPLSRAVAAAAGAGPLADDVREVPGLGVEGWIDGARYRLGSAEWVGVESAANMTGPSLWFAPVEGDPIRFAFKDQLHEGADTVIADLKAQGLGIEILSGDTESAVAEVAAALNLSDWRAKVSPQGKVERLTELNAQNKKVLMVGDGLNDAGALAMAHASLAPGGAMDVSQSASDAVYSGGLKAIRSVLNVSKRTRQVMVQNFGLAAAYNFVAVPIAVTGNVTPLIAAIAMSASSLIVTLNALRINASSSA
ncbi:MAG: heavy metal translocating P-type ATPase [Hyphomonadaceae bacterium]|nr:heavy metal translocating P-type ATPase [Hyphomonadaceae bacterium]